MGYVSGKNPAFKAFNSIISTIWKCEATHTIHETGWLIYHFKSEEDKLTVVRVGPYLMYGRPLVLRPMTKNFNFSSAEMSRVPVWVKFPSLPLWCWSPVCLSKIASVIGKPIQCDRLTSNLARMSYARVLVEIDLLEKLRHSVEISLPEGLFCTKKLSMRPYPSIATFAMFLAIPVSSAPKLLLLPIRSLLVILRLGWLKQRKEVFLVDWVLSSLNRVLLLCHICKTYLKTKTFQ